MRYFVILLNILLISLILYYFLGKTNSIIENLEGCPIDKKNIIYRNQANINRLFSELNTTKALCSTDLKPLVSQNFRLAVYNTALIKKASAAVQSKAAEKEKELDKLSSKHDV